MIAYRELWMASVRRLLRCQLDISEFGLRLFVQNAVAPRWTALHVVVGRAVLELECRREGRQAFLELGEGKALAPAHAQLVGADELLQTVIPHGLPNLLWLLAQVVIQTEV